MADPARSRFALAVAAFLALSLPAAAACVVSDGLAADAGVVTAPWCVAGTVRNGEEAHTAFATTTDALWTVAVEGLPGQAGQVALATSGPGARVVWRGTVSAAGGRAGPPLLLPAGAYELIAATPGAVFAYRVALDAAALPPAFNGEGVRDAFRGLSFGTDGRITLPWTVAGTPDGTLWTVAAQGGPGLSATLALRNAAGDTLVYTSSPDEAGVLRLPDLDLPAGDYAITLDSPPLGMPVTIAAATDARPAGFATEPDERPEMAHPLVPGVAAMGRLTTNGAYGESDMFALVVPDGAAALLFDVALTAPGASLTLALVDETGNPLMSRDGTGLAILHGLVLGPGRHLFKASGTLPPDATYTLLAEEMGRPGPGAEVEPNDRAVDATPWTGDAMAGHFTGGDYDNVALGIAAGLELWDVEATGAGIGQLQIYDGAGNVIARAQGSGSPVLRLSRLLLPPGRTVVRIDGTDSSWLLRARRIGPPVAGEEYEPNDDPARALVLPVDAPQTGWLDRADDRDLYAFHLAAERRVRLTLAAPVDVPVRLQLSWGAWNNRIAQPATSGAAGEPQTLVWDGLLPPGDYIVDLNLEAGPSRDPYTLTLALPETFDRPLDLEPNDDPWRAVALPAGRALTGTIAGNDTDWFALDPALPAGPLVVRADALAGPLALHLARGDPAAPERLADVYVYQPGETATLDLPAGGGLLLSVTGVRGAYALTVGGAAAGPAAPAGGARPKPTPGGAAPVPDGRADVAPPALPVTATLTLTEMAVAAFAAEAQRLDGTLAVRNDGNSAVTLRLAAAPGDERWRLDGLPATIDLAAGATATIPVTIEVAADARSGTPVDIDVGLLADGGAAVTARARITVDSNIDPVAPHRYLPFPTALLGGIDVAWAALGAAPTDPASAALFDDVIDVDGIALRADAPPTVTLAGTAPVRIAGIILSPPAGGLPSDRLAGFAIEVSADGADFTRVFEARLSPEPREQAFVFDAPVEARMVRLVPLSAQGGPPVALPRLAELRVIAVAGTELDPDGFDVALPALGGHIVRTLGFGAQEVTGQGAVWPGTSPVTIPADRGEPAEWTIGFLSGRAARIASLAWTDRADTPDERRIRSVEVFASEAGPLGPWQSLGIWTVGTAADWTLPTPVWARALRFRVVEPAAGALVMPERIAVRETAGPSILGAWGDLSRTGPFEALAADGAPAAATAEASHDATAPTPLALGATAAGEVRRGVVEHWYGIDLPAETLSVTARFAGGLPPDVALTLVADDGTETPLQPRPDDPAILVAPATPGHWRIRVTQPVASVVVAWDTSGSVGAFYPAIDRMIRRLAFGLDPAREAINLVPFRGEGSDFLMPHFSGDRADVYAALHAYPLLDSSSDAERALFFAARALAGRAGARAIVLVTDASFYGSGLGEEVWSALSAGRTAVFALYLPADTDPVRARGQVNLMADWASAGNGGHLSRFGADGDGEAAFGRVAAWLDRPAQYAFTVAAETTPPPPGELSVVQTVAAAGATTAASPPGAIGIILDASGSMLQRLGGERRIDIAKTALQELGATELPDGIPIALRVFGNDRPDSCENELLLPLAPLDRPAFAAAIDRVQSVNLARTSIAATLRAVGGDLAGASGVRTILLVTDGEETCGGDPLAEIEALRAAGIEIRLNIVGFAVDDPAARTLLSGWAAAGGGQYLDAADGAGLAAAMRAATLRPFTVVDTAGAEVARGTIGGEAIVLPAGDYTVRVEGAAEQAVRIVPGGAVVVDIEPGR